MVGLPRALIKKYGISKKAWAIFRGSKTTSGASPKPKSKRSKSSQVKSVVHHMVKRSRKGKRAGRNAISKMLNRFKGWFITGIKLTALAGPAIASAVQNSGNAPVAIGDAMQKYTMINPMTGEVRPARLIEGWGPAVVTNLITKLVKSFGV